MSETIIPKYLVIDTETSGLFDFSKPADADGQPRMASLAMIYLDAEFHILSVRTAFIKPDGWEILPEATAINGLTMDILNANGEPVRTVLDEYVAAVDHGLIVVAFNAQFDTKVLRGELRRAGIDDRFEKTPNLCTMRLSTDIVKAPKKSGKGWKFPKLAEACAHFKITQAAAHTALDDARACVDILKKLAELKVDLTPEVHYAKEQPKGA